MSFEIGDSFKIVDTEYFKYGCKDQREFLIKSFSKSGHSVYYLDDRTNPKCRCQNCSMIKGVKCIGVVNIELVSKRLQRERNLKLKSLGI
jgi:hypothetical protein